MSSSLKNSISIALLHAQQNLTQPSALKIHRNKYLGKIILKQLKLDSENACVWFYAFHVYLEAN